jgi:uncharacterized protein (UPF0297 family)
MIGFDKDRTVVDKEKTITYKVAQNQDFVRQTLSEVYNALVTKGYNPLNQLVGYLLTEDPTYITNYNNARNLIAKIERDELLRELLKSYLNI